MAGRHTDPTWRRKKSCGDNIRTSGRWTNEENGCTRKVRSLIFLVVGEKDIVDEKSKYRFTVQDFT